MNKKYLLTIPIILGGFILYNLMTQNDSTDYENTSNPIITSTEIAQAETGQATQALSLMVNPEPSVNSVKRVGININQWTTWGAEQLMKNIVKNPGFEGQFDRVVVIVSRSDENSFSDGKDLGMPDGYWDGAAFEVRSGPSAGTVGKVASSLNTGTDSLPQYFTEGNAPQLQPKDVIILTKELSSDPVPQWWIPDRSADRVKTDPKDPRPGSTGTQSIVLMPSQNDGAEINFYFDAMTNKAGKLLLVEGPWKLSFWVKGEGDGGTLTVKFARLNGSEPFVVREVVPTEAWQEQVIEFTGKDNGNPEVLQLQFYAWGPDTKVKIDDVYLGPVQEGNPTAFRQEAIDMLKELKPSYLRDWQGQLTDTFANRIADPYSRKTFYFRGHGGQGSQTFPYSLPETLDLVETVGARPWIIIPTTLNDEEASQLGKWLAEHASRERFGQVVVEFGNENWNWIFRSGGIPYPESHGQVADRVFKKIEEAAGGNVNLVKAVNGQHAVPDFARQFLESTPSADWLAVAPYFFYRMDNNGSMEENIKSLFAGDGGLLEQERADAKAMNKKLAIYEMNLTTAQGTASEAERDPLVAGMISGTALAKQILLNMFTKTKPVVVYAFTQYDTKTWDIQDRVKLWGVTRDLSTTKRFRPTGLAINMLNSVINGSMHQIQAAGGTSSATEKLTMAAFRYGKKWTAAVASESPEPVTLQITFPKDNRAVPTWMDVLTAASPFDTNEIEEKVTIQRQNIQSVGRTVSFTIPPYGFVVLNTTPSGSVKMSGADEGLYEVETEG